MRQTIQLIPYADTELRWHLSYNVFPKLNSSTIDHIIETIEKVNEGELQLDDEIKPGTGVTVSEMLEDLQIEFCY
jgi:hypothetical protein